MARKQIGLNLATLTPEEHAINEQRYAQLRRDTDDQFICNMRKRLAYYPEGTTIEQLIERNLDWIRGRYLAAAERTK